MAEYLSEHSQVAAIGPDLPNQSIHLDSLARLSDGGLFRAVEFGLASISPVVNLTSIAFGELGWIDRGWGRRATLTFEMGGTSLEKVVSIPWLLDEAAANPVLVITDIPHIGAFRGTCWKAQGSRSAPRCRQPLVGYVWKPGVHRVTWPVRDGNEYRVIVVGDFGTAWRLAWTSWRASATSTQEPPSSSDDIGISSQSNPIDSEDTALEGAGALIGVDQQQAWPEIDDDSAAHAESWYVDGPLEADTLGETHRQVGMGGQDRHGIQDSRVYGVRIHSRYSVRGPDRCEFRINVQADGGPLHGDGQPKTAAGEHAEDESELLIEQLNRYITGLPESADEEIKEAVQWLATAKSDDRQRVKNREPLTDQASMRVPMHPENWVESGLGDAICSAVAVALSRTAANITLPNNAVKAEDRAAVVELLFSAIAKAIDDVAVGRGEFSGRVVAEHPINTLARLETARQRTFLGLGGLENFDGRLHLRVLPQEWRTHLCPLQTVESADIGLIRHASLGRGPSVPDPDQSASTYEDLSIAAALIPYIGHDDPTRAALGSKMLKQAVILDNPEPPLIRTGIEGVVGEYGLTRSPLDGEVTKVDHQSRCIEIEDGNYRRHSIPWGFNVAHPHAQGDQWRVVVGAGTADAPVAVRKGDVLAQAPDVLLEEPVDSSSGEPSVEPVLAYGLNAVVAFIAWKGMNYEDGIVVSRSFAERMRSTHIVRLSAPFDASDVAHHFAIEPDCAQAAARSGNELLRGTCVMEILGAGGTRTFSLPEDGTLIPGNDERFGYTYLEFTDREVRLAYRVSRPLQIGDKLTTRHGGKGVVTCIEDDENMPRLPGGQIVDVLLNPLGVIRRLNIGTFMELARGLDLCLNDEGEWSDEWRSSAPRAKARRKLGRDERLRLACTLESRGAPGGKLRLVDAAGVRIGPDGGYMAGPLYLVKLNHLAKQKSGSRAGDSESSPLTLQPVRTQSWRSDRTYGSPQRLGEMEVWSLSAVNAHKTIDDLWALRGVGDASLRGRRGILPSGLRAAIAHLAVGGIHFRAHHLQDSKKDYDLTVTPKTPDPAAVIRATWCGEECGELEDVFTAFDKACQGDRSLIPEPRKNRPNSENTAEPTAEQMATAILAWVVGQPSHGSPELAPGETLRFAIPLPVKVEHPWKERIAGTWRRPPHLSRLAILPPAFLTGGVDFASDPLAYRYQRILELVWKWRRDSAKPRADGKQWFSKQAEHDIAQEVRILLGWVHKGGSPWTVGARVRGKYGLMRRNGLGASTVRSGRAVLVGDPSIDPETVKLPSWMAEDLGVKAVSVTEPHADVVFVNRQPTLHPYNLQALRATPWGEDAVAIHPILLKAIAGDFDGDTVAVHRPVAEEVRAEIWDVRRPAAAPYSGADGRLLAKMDLDVALGFTLGPKPQTATPPASGMLTIDERASFLESLARDHRLGLKQAQQWAPSIVDLDPSGTLVEVLADLQQHATDLYKGISNLDDTGMSQFLVARGTAVSPCHDLPDVDIQGNYIDGLDDCDYFAAAQPAIGNLAQKKLLTPLAGALTRALVLRGYDIAISEDDCGAHETQPPAGLEPVLACTNAAGVCRSAYGRNLETDQPVGAGDLVGLRAALFIGEHSTQKALKSIHERANQQGDVSAKAELEELWRIFLNHKGFRSAGRITIPQGHLGLARPSAKTIQIDKLFDVIKTQRGACQVLVDRVCEILDGVSPVHIAVIIRHMYINEGDGLSYTVPSVFTRTVWDGNLRSVIPVLQRGMFDSNDQSERLATMILNQSPGEMS